jgi:hypothetical protein
MSKVYSQEEVNELLLEDAVSKVFREVRDFKDTIYSKAFSEGYKTGFQEATNRNQNETKN